ncbi:hypothetical protein ACWPKO_19625 (plasmid) [Coraliomargarita sp. W4R53]
MITQHDLHGMSTSEVNNARRAGELDSMLRGESTEQAPEQAPPPEPEPPRYIVPSEGTGSGPAPGAQIDAHQLARMSPDQINQARNAGRLNRLMGF